MPRVSRARSGLAASGRPRCNAAHTSGARYKGQRRGRDLKEALRSCRCGIVLQVDESETSGGTKLSRGYTRQTVACRKCHAQAHASQCASSAGGSGMPAVPALAVAQAKLHSSFAEQQNSVESAIQNMHPVKSSMSTRWFMHRAWSTHHFCRLPRSLSPSLLPSLPPPLSPLAASLRPSGGHQRNHTSRSVGPQLPSPPHASSRPPAYVWPCWQ